MANIKLNFMDYKIGKWKITKYCRHVSTAVSMSPYITKEVMHSMLILNFKRQRFWSWKYPNKSHSSISNLDFWNFKSNHF